MEEEILCNDAHYVMYLWNNFNRLFIYSLNRCLFTYKIVFDY